MTDSEWPADGEIDAVFRLEVDRAWGIPVKSIPYPIVCGARFAIRHFLKEAAGRANRADMEQP